MKTKLVLCQSTSKLFLKKNHRATSHLKPNHTLETVSYKVIDFICLCRPRLCLFSLLSGKPYQVPHPEGRLTQHETQLIPAQPGCTASHAQPHTDISDISVMCNSEHSQKLIQTQLLGQSFTVHSHMEQYIFFSGIYKQEASTKPCHSLCDNHRYMITRGHLLNSTFFI